LRSTFRNFATEMNYTLNVKGQLMDLSRPQVMGILNVTPDSFYSESRAQTEHDIMVRARDLVNQGAAIIDIGACSTRPGSTLASEEEEMQRLRLGLQTVRAEMPSAVLSIDTFRSNVARMAVEEFGADIINDVSGGCEEMFRLVAKMGVPYVLSSVEASMHDMLLVLAEKVQQLRDLGQKDIILDPGFGFGKTLEQNYEVMHELERLQVLELPILVGVSRKSMIFRRLDFTPAESLNGTSVLNTISLMKGASILRVHDVKEAVECVKIWEGVKEGK
jgi:dihydropteroate synthase